MNATVCPISEYKVNENITRLNAAFTFGLGLLAVSLQQPLIFAFLAIDFFIRAYFQGKGSLLRLISFGVSKGVGLEPRFINAGSKIFAAKIGFVFSLVIFLLFLGGYPIIASAFGYMLVLFAFLEAAFRFCVACQIYTLFYKE